jgi:hypothetical protein
MSNIHNDRPYIRPTATAEDARTTVSAADIIVDAPTLDELSFVERADRSRPYVAGALVLLACCFFLACVTRLVRRAYAENVASNTPRAADRRSLRKAAKALADAKR